ncbi:MAG: hypothetical protein Kow0068_05110 [Marinilabiliales bacterium]
MKVIFVLITVLFFTGLVSAQIEWDKDTAKNEGFFVKNTILLHADIGYSYIYNNIPRLSKYPDALKDLQNTVSFHFGAAYIVDKYNTGISGVYYVMNSYSDIPVDSTSLLNYKNTNYTLDYAGLGPVYYFNKGWFSFYTGIHFGLTYTTYRDQTLMGEKFFHKEQHYGINVFYNHRIKIYKILSAELGASFLISEDMYDFMSCTSVYAGFCVDL